MGTFEHQSVRLAAMGVCSVVFLALTAVYVLAFLYDEHDLLDNNLINVFEYYHTELTPAKWSYYAWIAVYVWQLLWLIYGLSTICRFGVDSYLYYSPPYLSTSVYVIFTLNNILNMLWVFLFDRKELIPSLVAIAFVAFSALVCLGLSLRGTGKYGGLLEISGLGKEVWLTRFSVQNGLALYAAFASITTLVNLAIVMIDWEENWVDFYPGYVATEWSQDTATICLGVMALDLVLWTALDFTLLTHYTCYVFTPYLAFGWFAIAMLEENYADGSRNSLLTVGILAAAMLAIIVKFTSMIWRFVNTYGAEASWYGNGRPRSKPPSVTQLDARPSRVGSQSPGLARAYSSKPHQRKPSNYLANRGDFVR